MVAVFHGLKVNLARLRLRYPVSLRGSTLKSLINTAAELGLDARPLRLQLKQLQNLELPCILHWEMSHFVVLKSASTKHVVIHDPARGERRCSITEISNRFTGIALELKPAADFVRRDERQSLRLSDLWTRISGITPVLLQTLILSLVVQLFVLAAPFYMQLVVDEVLTKSDIHLLVVLALGFGLFMVIREIASTLRASVILHVSSLLEFRMVSNLFRHLLHLPMDWYEKRHVGDVLSRFSSTLPIRNLLAEGLVATFIDGVMAISTVILMFVYSTTLGMIVLFAILAYLVLRIALYRPLRQRSEEQIATRAREQSFLIESIRGIQSIKTCGAETDRQSLWQNKNAEAINSSVRLGKLRIGMGFANRLIFGIENTLVVYAGALTVIEGRLTIGMLFAFVAYKQHAIEKATALIERFMEFRLLKMHLERISDIALSPVEKYSAENRPTSSQLQQHAASNTSIEARDVSFRYAESDPWILHNVSFSIRRGEMVSFIGASGSGKSTLMKILLGLCQPTSGQILISGIPVTEYGLARYRSMTGTVMQDDALLSGSIADNISFFDLQPDVDRIYRVAVQSAIHDEIVSMPMGFNSLVGDMGTALSAGQRQRVLLARALYREPEILILDEGTANLDSGTEISIVRMLSELKMTKICVAHGARIPLASNRVVLLHSGSIQEIDKQQCVINPPEDSRDGQLAT